MGTFVFFFIAIVIVLVGVTAFQKSVTEAWSNAASKLRLNFKGGYASGREIYGSRTDMALQIKTEKSGKSTWTVYLSEFAEPLPFSIHLQPQTFLSDLGNAFLNRIDIETGDPGFDTKIIVESKDPEQVRDFLDERARVAIMKLRARFDLFELKDYGISVKKRKLVSTEGELVEDIQTIENATRKIWESAVPENQEPVRVPPPLPSQRKTEEEAEVPESAENVEEPTPADEPERSVVPLPETGVIEEAHNERAGREDAALSPETQSEEVEPETPFEVSDEAPVSEFAQRCIDVFAECQGRYAMTRAFDEKLKGEEILASLTLVGVHSYSMDKHFGRGPGILRTFTVGKLPSGEKLVLVADTGEERTLADIRSKEGEPDAVLGNLIAFDPFSHTLFLKSHVTENEDG